MMTTIRAVILAVILAACTNKVAVLEREANAVVDENQRSLDALVNRITTLKHELRGNLPGWQDMLRLADLANDELGLPPFAQTVAPTADWKPSPGSLLGMGPYVRAHAAELASHGKRDELEFLIADERRRYAQGIAETDARLAEVERRLATVRSP